MRPKLQKRSALKIAGRIIPGSGGFNTPQLALGFIPVIKMKKVVDVGEESLLMKK